MLDELRGLGEKVTTDSVSGQDVTEEYVDLESRERNLRATEESLLRLYDRAENVEEALSIQRELTTVRGEIELVQGRIKYLDQRSAYSQITLNIQPVTSPPPPKPTWDPGEVVERAWDASLASSRSWRRLSSRRSYSAGGSHPCSSEDFCGGGGGTGAPDPLQQNPDT